MKEIMNRIFDSRQESKSKNYITFIFISNLTLIQNNFSLYYTISVLFNICIINFCMKDISNKKENNYEFINRSSYHYYYFLFMNNLYIFTIFIYIKLKK
jgi:hypothetical protein